MIPHPLPPDFAVSNLQIILVEKFLVVKKWHLFKMSPTPTSTTDKASKGKEGETIFPILDEGE